MSLPDPKEIVKAGRQDVVLALMPTMKRNLRNDSFGHS